MAKKILPLSESVSKTKPKKTAAAFSKHVVMVAAENGALQGGKAGGIADVIRDLPAALAKLGYRVTVVTPSYGFLHERNPITSVTQVSFPFAGRAETADVYTVKGKKAVRGVRHVLVENIWIRGDPIYFHDIAGRPFATDASKFAMFCSAVGKLVAGGTAPFEAVDVVHLHDWHAATLLLLRRLHADFTALKKIRTVFTIHNLGIQGTRPAAGEESSLASWFPEIVTDAAASKDFDDNLADYRYALPCYTPMQTGIQLADAVNAVSPSYAEEILEPSDPASDLWRGEGLESFLAAAREEGRLFGILNGLDYPVGRKVQRLPFPKLCEIIAGEIAGIVERGFSRPSITFALERLNAWKDREPKAVLTAVSRITSQKVGLYFQTGYDNRTAFERLMEEAEDRGCVFIMLGNSMPELEVKLEALMRGRKNFLFLNVMSETIADLLYANGDLFLMPSLYEPCGISQMLAMRDGQPPVVHLVGGLRDTVIDKENGFCFDGRTRNERVESFLQAVTHALSLKETDPGAWNRIVKNARSARFLWSDSAKAYAAKMYRL